MSPLRPRTSRSLATATSAEDHVTAGILYPSLEPVASMRAGSRRCSSWMRGAERGSAVAGTKPHANGGLAASSFLPHTVHNRCLVDTILFPSDNPGPADGGWTIRSLSHRKLHDHLIADGSTIPSQPSSSKTSALIRLQTSYRMQSDASPPNTCGSYTCLAQP